MLQFRPATYENFVDCYQKTEAVFGSPDCLPRLWERSREVTAFYDGEKLVAVFGFYHASALTNKIVLWVCVGRPTHRAIKIGPRLAKRFVRSLSDAGYDIYATVDSTCHRAIRFAMWLGFKIENILDLRYISKTPVLSCRYRK